MKIVRYRTPEGEARYGSVVGEKVRDIKGDIFGDFTVTAVEHKLSGLKILPPCEPSKIVALALNYKAHAAEGGREAYEEPALFIKPSTAVIGHEDVIIYPPQSQRVDHEAELGVVMKRVAKDVPEGEALNYVLGYTCFNDVSARDIQRRERHITRSKSFDTFAPMGPYIVTGIDPSNLKFRCLVNGEVRQSSTTALMIHNVPKLISFISHVMTLLPGDIIATGTCEGISPMRPGDVVEVEIEGIGCLRNYLRTKEG